MKKISERILILGIISFIVLINMFIDIKCPFKEYFHIPCAGCGMTRAIKAVLKFDFKTAFYYHPLFWTIPIIILLILFGYKFNRKLEISIWIGVAVLFLGVFLLRIYYGFAV